MNGSSRPAPVAVQDQELRIRIMRGIYRVWFWRRVAPLLGIEALFLAGVAAGVLTHISLRQIMLNALAASSDLRAFVLFFVNNFFVKSIQSRLLAAAYVALVAFFIRDLRAAQRALSVVPALGRFAAARR